MTCIEQSAQWLWSSFSVSKIALGFESQQILVRHRDRSAGTAVFRLAFSNWGLQMRSSLSGIRFYSSFVWVSSWKKHTGGPCFAFETHREVFCVKSFEVKNDDESHNAALVIQSVLLLELNSRRESSGSFGNRRKSDFVKSVRKMSKSGTTMIFATPLGESEE